MAKSVVALLALALGVGAQNTEYVGIVDGSTLNWVQVDYPDDVTSAKDVTLSDASGNKILGAWDGLEGVSLKLTGRVFGDKLYGYLNNGKAPGSGSCCADRIRVWDKSDGSYNDIDLVTPIEAVYADSDYDYATHTFHLDEYNGEVVAFCMAQFEAPDLGNAPVDVVVAISTETGKIVPTKDGDDYFSMWEKLGTTSTDAADSIFKEQHVMQTAETATNFTNLTEELLARRQLQGPPSGGQEQWHGNGVARFTMTDGTQILAITHIGFKEAILMSDPWGDAKSSGKILQRFGFPGANGVSHRFGVDSSQASFTGMHDIFYANSPDGRETATVFVNGVQGSSSSWVFEFDIKLVDEDSISKYTDSVFDTTYRSVALPFSNGQTGGGRPIGADAEGKTVWLVANKGAKGLYAVSEDGESKSFGSGQQYDPFIYIKA